MKRLLILAFIAFSFIANAQENIAQYVALNMPSKAENNAIIIEEEPIPDNLWGIDFSGIGTSGHYAGRITDGLYLGGEFGLLPSRFDWVIAGGKKTSQENTIWSKDKSEARVNDINQLIFLHFFARWKPYFQWIETEGGFRWAIFNRSGYDIDYITFDRFLGAYLKPTIGLRRIKIGFRLEAGYIRLDYHGNNHEFVSIISPLVRFNFR